MEKGYIKSVDQQGLRKVFTGAAGGRGKIGNFRYAPLIGPDIFSGILVKATGRFVPAFADEVLFGPLDIHVNGSITFKNKEEQMAFNESAGICGGVMDPTGIYTAGGFLLPLQIWLRSDRCTFGRGLVSEEWGKDSTREHSQWEKRDLPYGYLWWNNEDGYAAMGDGGNTIWVNTKEKIVTAMTGLFVPNVKDRIDFIWKQIESIFR